MVCWISSEMNKNLFYLFFLIFIRNEEMTFDKQNSIFSIWSTLHFRFNFIKWDFIQFLIMFEFIFPWHGVITLSKYYSHLFTCTSNNWIKIHFPEKFTHARTLWSIWMDSLMYDELVSKRFLSLKNKKRDCQTISFEVEARHIQFYLYEKWKFINA